MSAFYVVAYGVAVAAGDPRRRCSSRRSGCSTTFELFGGVVAALALVVAFEAWRTRARAPRSVRAHGAHADVAVVGGGHRRARRRRRARPPRGGRRRARALDARAPGSRRAPRAASATCTRRAEQIAEAVRARALWDAWSARAGEPLVGEEGALRLGGDVAADAGAAARRRRRGRGARARRRRGCRALRAGRRAAAVGPARRRDPRRARDRVAARASWATACAAPTCASHVAPGAASATPTARSPCGQRRARARAPGPSGSWPHVAMRRVVHLRVTFAAPRADLRIALAAAVRRPRGRRATWADRSGRFGALDLRRRRRAGALRARARRARRAARAARTRPPTSSGRASTSARCASACTPTRAAAFPGLGAAARRGRAACSRCCRATTRTPTSSTRRDGLTVVARPQPVQARAAARRESCTCNHVIRGTHLLSSLS